MQETIFIGGGGEGYATPQSLKLKYANRHGLIAGATGTGKTVTLQIMAEEFSAAGVPVFLYDVKSDLAGLAKSGGHASVWGTCAGTARFDAGGRTGTGPYQYFGRRQINGQPAPLCLVFAVAYIRIV